ncbi:hypothetical protein DM01DRAFT_1410352 [Hesseltinella vesiculosa]|uniref:DUF300-domain-containing protein n=1 Tax=Hesseltinella vesiculosa TaxID=101127 RepID=A0A1X2G7X9_9FUNG|nr:hypothetical protein DM01DRAFT_1410352 [Hesseltinella vesiculosa]
MDNSTVSTQCPHEPGFRDDGLFGQPTFNFGDVWQHPTYNWHIVGWLVCLLLLLITWGASLSLVVKHLRNYYDPEIQRHKARVILYPPIYSSLAWASYLDLRYMVTIMFFAVLFESFAVYNLYACLQSYLAPYRDEAQGRKEVKRTKVLFLFKVNLKSKWGMHYRIITDIMVFQYPVWSIIDAIVSMITQSHGTYCGDSYSFKGAHVYLTIINFTSLSIILSALFTYLAIFEEQWKMGGIKAHGMFWCVKGPIMVIFYIGELLLDGLVYANVIKASDPEHSADHISWTADEVKDGLYVIVICVTMCIASLLMLKYYNVDRRLSVAGGDDMLTEESQQKLYGPNGLLIAPQPHRLSVWMAFVDAYLSYIPEFLRNVVCCGVDSYRLARKRIELRARKRRAAGFQDTEHMLSPTLPHDYNKEDSATFVSKQRYEENLDEHNPYAPSAPPLTQPRYDDPHSRNVYYPPPPPQV